MPDPGTPCTSHPTAPLSLFTDHQRTNAETPQNSTALTPAELEVLQLLPSELTVGEIAAMRHVSTNTVNTQLKSIYRKLGVRRRLGAINAARQQALLPSHHIPLKPHPNRTE
ncbi:LuxR C-terminal-related transcriptional regulator [Streptomyces noursei]|uniref:response regulator transcription factor n=1 Tax=Streptomyces noursei TaxID=1971 RepID=UPI00081C9763|nr:transcriptional regulator, luxR family [Streptomyces noursei ATCC 11455]MCZ0991870.1 LuxR C-terminal-related transcriptional regulator [Streptomyces noursei]